MVVYDPDTGPGRSENTADVDICIIGGGVAGLLVASELGPASGRVLVLEGGPQSRADTAEEASSLQQFESSDAEYTLEVARGLGGTSQIWGGRMLPIASHEMAPRPYIGVQGWPLDSDKLEQAGERIQQILKLGPDPFEDPAFEGQLPPRMQQGVDVFRPRWDKWQHFGNRNVTNSLKASLAQRGHVEVWVNSSVNDLMVDEHEGRLTTVCGLSSGGRAFSVTARKFVFACGALETTRLMLLLNRRYGDRIFPADVLGHYFNDHLKLEIGTLEVVNWDAVNRIFGYRLGRRVNRSLRLELSPEAQEADRIAGGYIAVHANYSSSSVLSLVREKGREFQRGAAPHVAGVLLPIARRAPEAGALLRWLLQRQQLYIPPDSSLHVEARIEQVPSHQNYLALSDKCDTNGVPLVDVHWKPREIEERTLMSLVLRTKRYWVASGLQSIAALRRSGDLDGVDRPISAAAASTNHPAGSVRMGSSKLSSIVGPDLRCHQLANALVVSTAVYPSSGSANPTFTLMALAILAVETLSRAL